MSLINGRWEYQFKIGRHFADPHAEPRPLTEVARYVSPHPSTMVSSAWIASAVVPIDSQVLVPEDWEPAESEQMAVNEQ